ncbi:MAG: aminomethyl-transferring glycine dehydrogenase subunit GcvPB [Methanobacteriota archaeon]|nr:MAG: aminomethyl-transferring glycine dehydrogenase subunit GcvPB [Euryarchaeota archaeon]
MRYHQAVHDVPLMFEGCESGPDDDLEDEVRAALPEYLLRTSLMLPDLAEREVVKHFVNLSQMNFGVDNGFYPLGSCTMKYNPKICDEVSAWDTVSNLHPLQDVSTVQGALQVMAELEDMLCEIGGVDAVTLQPAAGAHGEFTGMHIVRAYHESRAEVRKEVILPETAHGTNPASAAMVGYDVLDLPSKDGCVEIEALKAAVSDDTAAFMLTNPNTLGLFERDVEEIAKIIHEAGALLYYDGANLNAIMGKTSPGKMDFDIVHFNLHKTFATPHGGGGPGAGPVGVKKLLEEFLPVPRIVRGDGVYSLDHDRPRSIGKVKSFFGNFAVLVRAHAYIVMKGGKGLERVSEEAVLNSNYLKEQLKDLFDMPYGDLRKHEFVLSGSVLKKRGVRTMDFAKRLLDYGFHAPTVYFPLIIDEALMIEPTESETKDTLDAFAEACRRIMSEDPELLRSAPHSAARSRIDEVKAARDMVLSWRGYLKKSDATISRA